MEGLSTIANTQIKALRAQREQRDTVSLQNRLIEGPPHASEGCPLVLSLHDRGLYVFSHGQLQYFANSYCLLDTNNFLRPGNLSIDFFF